MYYWQRRPPSASWLPAAVPRMQPARSVPPATGRGFDRLEGATRCLKTGFMTKGSRRGSRSASPVCSQRAASGSYDLLAQSGYFHAGNTGQERYTFTYEELPAGPKGLRDYLDKLSDA